MFKQARADANALRPEADRDAFDTKFLHRFLAVIRSTDWSQRTISVVEPVIMCSLLLMFGFRPCTLQRMTPASIVVTEERLTFTEGFRKGYFSKKTKLRRLGFPWLSCPAAKRLFERYS